MPIFSRQAGTHCRETLHRRQAPHPPPLRRPGTGSSFTRPSPKPASCPVRMLWLYKGGCHVKEEPMVHGRSRSVLTRPLPFLSPGVAPACRRGTARSFRAASGVAAALGRRHDDPLLVHSAPLGLAAPTVLTTRPGQGAATVVIGRQPCLAGDTGMWQGYWRIPRPDIRSTMRAPAQPLGRNAAPGRGSIGSPVRSTGDARAAVCVLGEARKLVHWTLHSFATSRLCRGQDGAR